MREAPAGVGFDGETGHVGGGFGHGAERRGRLDPAHGAGHRDCDQGFLALVTGSNQRETHAVARVQEHAVEAVLDVVLGEADRSVAGICSTDVREQARECPGELHGFRRGVR